VRKGRRGIFGLKKDFGKDKVGWFSNFAKAKKRVPAYAGLRNPSGIWVLDSVGLEGIGKN
jgi:hypothetical protein